MPAYAYALMLHGVIGGLDVFVNHEWLARLPRRPEALEEQRLHSAREAIFGARRGGRGNTRVQPRAERVLHLLLFVNLGMVIVLVGQALLGWYPLPTAIETIEHGWGSWVLSAMAAGSLIWALRDAACAAQLARVKRPADQNA